jgi:hypothetical protein
MNSLNEEKPFDKMKPVLLFLAIAMIGIICQFFFRKKIADKGIYTKCSLVNTEGYKGGKLLTIKYAFNGNTYQGIVHGSLGKGSIGKQYFIMLLPNKPAAPLLLEDNPVPDCLEQSPPPAMGWKKMPVCNN